MEVKEMRKEDLKVGMVVEVRSSDGVSLAMVSTSKYSEKCISGEVTWFPLNLLDENLEYMTAKILKVYDIAESNKFAHMVSTMGRELLWERPSYYNGKVVCVKNESSRYSPYTVGKIYEFKDGFTKDDRGSTRPKFDSPIKSIDDLNDKCYAKFIEVVE